MNFKRVIFFFTVYLIGYNGIAYVTNPRVKFEKYSISEGLSHLGVSSFFQDSKGFLWIGTYDGLNRFDGINFKIFKHTPDDSTTLINNRVRCVFEHSSGKLFVGTEGGICVYNSELETFSGFNLGSFDNTSLNALQMFEDSKGRLWVLTSKNVVYIFDMVTNELKSLFIVPNENNSPVFYNDILEDEKGYIWLATSNSLICYSPNLEFISLDLQPFLKSKQIRCIEMDAEGNLWVSLFATVKKFRVTYNEDNIRVRLIDDFRLNSAVLSLLVDKIGNIWAGSSSRGIYRIVYDGKNYRPVENYSYDSSLKESVSSNWISNIYEDNADNIWFATAEKGINKYSYGKELFINIDKNSGLKSNYVLELFQLDEERLLCGTRNSLSVYNISSEKVEDLWFDDLPISEGEANVPAIYKDSYGYLWIGTTNGLYYLRAEGKKTMSKFDFSEVQETGIVIAGIIEDRYGNIWVGTARGVFRLSFTRKHEIAKILDFDRRSDDILKDLRVSDLYVDPKDSSIWFGTWYRGLYHINISGNEEDVNDFQIDKYQFESGNPETLRSNFISAVHRSQDGELWVGTEGGGFSKMDMQNGKVQFIHYTESEGLSNNVVKSILEDKNGKLYIGTNYKLNVFDRETNSFSYYDVNDGLKSDYFNRVALTLSNGLMVFGGNEGITIFDPKALEIPGHNPVPEFGDFQLSYKTVHPGEEVDGKVIINKSLSCTDEIKLRHFQNTFSIELLGISFDNPEDNPYKYKLVDYDQDWIFTRPENRMASYSNVPPGEYLFEFYVSNNENEWIETSKQLKIVISPPFWKTGWAYSLYVAIIVGVVIAVFYFLLNIERLKSNLRIEQLEKEKEKEINDVKLRFFTNISHEFKTPVSLILGPAENLIKKFRENDGVKRNLFMIHEQANYLLRLLDQLLEFRKVENESVKLRCVEKDIVSFVKHIYRGFESKSVEKNIKYSFDCASDQLQIWFDPAKIEMIIYNLLSNAFKFTPTGGMINLSIESDNEYVFVKIEDSGPGISDAEQKKIFERFYQSKTSENLHGTGIGLALSKSLAILHHGGLEVESELGKGACFVLKLHKGDDHLAEEETVLDKQETLDKLVLDTDVFQANGDRHLEKNSTISSPDRQQTLLLIEDNFQMRKYLEEILGEQYHVIATDNGNDGFKLACNKVPEIIVSDVMMPGIDGVQLTEKLKKEIITSHIPVILLTAKAEFASYIKGIEIGADDYINKPFHVERLLVRIKNLLENRARLRSRYTRNLEEIQVDMAEQVSVRDKEFVNSLYQIAEQNLDNSDFSADDFSKAVYMSRTNFYKKLKALTDQTPGEFLKAYRVKKAGELLSSGEYSVSQVALMVGFKSRSHFYQSFKNFYGELPADFISKKV